MFFLYDTLISTGERWYNRRGMTVFYSCRELNHASSLPPGGVKLLWQCWDELKELSTR